MISLSASKERDDNGEHDTNEQEEEHELKPEDENQGDAAGEDFEEDEAADEGDDEFDCTVSSSNITLMKVIPTIQFDLDDEESWENNASPRCQ